MSNILDRANDIVNNRAEEKDRMYGPFSESMERTAAMYNMLRDATLKAEDVYYVLICLKLTREARNHKEDNLLDAVAYLGALNNHIENEKGNIKPSE